MKNPKASPFIRKNDFFIIGIIVLCATVGLIFAKTAVTKGSYAQIRLDGRIIAEIPLEQSADKTFTLPEADDVKFEIKDSKICIKENDCKDRVCINTGFIGNSHESIVCLPKKLSVVIRTESNNGAQFDATVG